MTRDNLRSYAADFPAAFQNPPTTPDAEAALHAGYVVYRGEPGDDELAGRYWWTRAIAGNIECGENDYATAAEAWDDAVRHRREDPA